MLNRRQSIKLMAAGLAGAATGLLRPPSAHAERWSMDAAAVMAPTIATHQGRLHMVLIANNRTRALLHMDSQDGIHWRRLRDLGEAASHRPGLASYNGSLACVFRANNANNDGLLSVWNSTHDAWSSNRRVLRWLTSGVELWRDRNARRLWALCNAQPDPSIAGTYSVMQDLSSTLRRGVDNLPTVRVRSALYAGEPAVAPFRRRLHAIYTDANGHLFQRSPSPDTGDWAGAGSWDKPIDAAAHGHVSLAIFRNNLVCAFQARNQTGDILLIIWDPRQGWLNHQSIPERTADGVELLVHGGRLLLFFPAANEGRQLLIRDISAMVGNSPKPRRSSRPSRPGQNRPSAR